MLAILLLGVYCVETALYIGLLLLTGWWWNLPVVGIVLSILLMFAFLRMLFLIIACILAWASRSPKPADMKLGAFAGASLFFCEYVALLRAFFILHPFERLFRTMRGATASDARTTPVLLVHGWLCNGGYWQPMIRRLRRDFCHIYTVNLEPPLAGINRYARDLAQAVDDICVQTKSPQVLLVCHSMGGLVARAYVQRHGGDKRVAKIVTLGTPHHGSRAAWFAAGVNVAQMRPGSAWLESLNAERWPGTPITSIYSVDDNLVVPHQSAHLEFAKNVSLAGIGHLALGFSRRVQKMVLDELTEADVA